MTGQKIGYIRVSSGEQNIYGVLRYLKESGYIRKEGRGIYIITDPLLEKYLAND